MNLVIQLCILNFKCVNLKNVIEFDIVNIRVVVLSGFLVMMNSETYSAIARRAWGLIDEMFTFSFLTIYYIKNPLVPILIFVRCSLKFNNLIKVYGHYFAFH